MEMVLSTEMKSVTAQEDVVLVASFQKLEVFAGDKRRFVIVLQHVMVSIQNVLHLFTHQHIKFADHHLGTVIPMISVMEKGTVESLLIKMVHPVLFCFVHLWEQVNRLFHCLKCVT